MRRAAKVDRNQAEIVAALRKAGCSVQSLAKLGQGVPDLLVGRAGRNWLFEVKNPDQPKAKQALKPEQIEWRNSWCGQVCVVRSIEDCLIAMKT